MDRLISLKKKINAFFKIIDNLQDKKLLLFEGCYKSIKIKIEKKTCRCKNYFQAEVHVYFITIKFKTTNNGQNKFLLLHVSTSILMRAKSTDIRYMP